MPQDRLKTSRVEARLTPDTLAAVRRAAELQGRSVSDFVVEAAREAARKTIEEMQLIRLSVADQKAFADAILDPPAPNPALRRAAAAHRDLLKATS